MKCAHCGHQHVDADGRMDIDRCMQCVWTIRHMRKHHIEFWETKLVCTDFDH